MPKKKSILIIDDDIYICSILKKFLERSKYEVETVFTGASARNIIKRKNYDMVLCDYRLPDSDGLQILRQVKLKKSEIPVIIMTAYAEIKMAVELIKAGAYDYITKPIQHEEVLRLIEKALKSNKVKTTRSSFEEDFITGPSEKMNTVMRHVEVVAPTELNVMIEGETGSGKEYIARAIHYRSKRVDKPFIAVDCGAIPKELANSVLFGHVKGAFTGAISDKTGYFEEASGGTLFLDEIGNLPYENQVKILRALQERVISRTGDNNSINVDVRLIIASNDNLLNRVKTGEFREDLYHRLAGFKIPLPPLRDRKEDIMEFTWFFVKKANKEFDKNVSHIDDKARELLVNYRWHGNIRELNNVINRVVLLSQGDAITPELLPDEIRSNPDDTDKGPEINGLRDATDVSDLKSATLITEREIINNALAKTNNNKSKAARLLKIDRKTLYNKIRLYNLES